MLSIKIQVLNRLAWTHHRMTLLSTPWLIAVTRKYSTEQAAAAAAVNSPFIEGMRTGDHIMSPDDAEIMQSHPALAAACFAASHFATNLARSCRLPSVDKHDLTEAGVIAWQESLLTAGKVLCRRPCFGSGVRGTCPNNLCHTVQ